MVELLFPRAELMDPESAGARNSTNLQSCTYLLVVGGEWRTGKRQWELLLPWC